MPLVNAGLVTLSPLAQFSVVTGAASHGGVNALKFTTVDNGTTYAERTVVGASVVSFWWRVSSEKDYDLFKYSVDGVQQQAISGDGVWAYQTFTLAAGTHQIRWTYTKDGADASFDDAGYLDDLVIVDAYKDLQVTLAGAVVTASGTLDFGTEQQSSADVARSLTLKNNGTIPLAVTATIPSNSGFAFSTGLLTRSFTINAGQQTTLDMKMLTATGGQKTALLGIVATGSLTAPPAVTLSGFIQPTAPVIACSWSGGALTSGQSTAVDFGTAPSDVTFTVANTGTGPLSLSTVTVSPEANFQVTSQPASTVAINGTTTFTVRALDANRGNHLATVTVTSDAYNAPSFTIPVTSQSTPNIACSWSGGALTSGQSTAVDFGTAPSDVTFTVANTGTGLMSLSTVTVSPSANFQVTSQPASTVAINGSTTFTVRALDANRGNHLATVTVASDAPNAPSFTIPVASRALLAVAGTGAVDGSLVNTGTTALWDTASTILADGSTGLAIKTGATANSGNSTFGATFEGPGILSWNWKVSAQQNYDWLLCEVNGVEVAGISTKTAAWQSQVLQIPAGSQVRWIYRKDAANSSGTDSGHLADIRFSKFATAQSSFDTWSAARGGLTPTQVLPKGGMQAMFAWLGGVDPTTGPAVGTYQPTFSSGIYQYRYRVDKGAAGMTQPQVSTDLVNWDSRRMKQTLISEDSTSAVIELSVAATGKTFSRLAANVPVYTPPAPAGFSLIPAGSFTMGNSVAADTDITDAPTRTVTVSGFYMAQNLVTKAEWDEVRTWGLANGYADLVAGSGTASNHPVVDISWYHMLKWCNARSQQGGFVPVYYTDDAQTTVYKTGDVDVTNAQVKWSANGYRFPTEAEWEKAARGGLSAKRFPWGDTINQSQANYYGYTYSYDLSGPVGYHPSYPAGGTSPAGSLATNGYGLVHMAGNVWQWCWDWYGSYDPAVLTDPRGPAASGTGRVRRGGSGGDDASGCRVALRVSTDPSFSYFLGFRVARSLVQ